jgi:hypothetical protein
MKTLRQVKLQRRSTRGHIEDVFWIEARFAKTGTRVQDEDGIVWVVAEVYNIKKEDDLDKAYGQWREFARKLEGH